MEKTHLTTKEVAQVFGVQSDTIRRGLCVDGAYLGLRPIKLPNGRLLWPAEKIKQILSGGSR